MTEPGELLDRLAVQWEQVTSPTYGYSGTFTPAGALGHWTASGTGSDTSSDVLEARHYHACTSRSGIVKLGGWKVRQGHGGEGRMAPQRLARDGAMTLWDLVSWHDDGSDDDTSSGANQYFYGVCIDNNGVGEVPSPEQYRAYVSSLAVFLLMAGATTVGSLIDHAASTNRKIDLATSAPLSPELWWNDVATTLALLLAPEVTLHSFSVAAMHPSGYGWMAVRDDGNVYVINAKGHSEAKYFGSVLDLDKDPSTPDGLVGTAPPIHAEWSTSGKGYTIVNADGGVFCFGDAAFPGSFTEWQE